MELAGDKEYTRAEQLIINAIEKKGDTAMIKIYNTDRRKAPSCHEIMPEDGQPIDAYDAVEEVAEYIEQEADSYEKFIVAVKKNSQDGGTKVTIQGRKKRASLGGNNNNNGMAGMGGNMGIVGHLLNQNQSLQTNSMQTENRVMQLISKMNEDRIQREADSDVAYYKSVADKERKKRKKGKKKKKKTGLAREILNSEPVQELGKMAMESMFGSKEDHNKNIIPIKPIEEQRTNIHANVAGTEPNSTRNTTDVPDDELTAEELEALEGYDYLVRYQEPDAGLTIHAVCRMLVKKRNHFAAKSIRKMIDAEKDIILQEKGA